MSIVSITISKTGFTAERDTAAFPPATIDYLLQNGFSQRLRDVHASIKRSDYETDEAYKTDVDVAVCRALEQLDTGTPPTSGRAAPGVTKARALERASIEELETALRAAKAKAKAERHAQAAE